MILNIAQLVLSILLTAAILMQARGSGAGIAFGGDGNVYRTRRGVEKKLHAATVVIAILFLAVALANVLLSI
ncbi:MAG: preprotein translocase subunit SecG [Patescibacteria group bacterium]|jgi:preprotein translocase subunit SecG